MPHKLAARVLIVVMATSLGTGLVACNVLARGTSSATAPPEITPTSGPVTIAVDQQKYEAGWPIIATIHNGLAVPIFAQVNHTDCTVVKLELWVNGAWKTQAPCEKLLSKPHVAEIGPGTVFTQIVPGLNEFRIDPWPSGTYQVALLYTTRPEQSAVAHSESFLIEQNYYGG